MLARRYDKWTGNPEGVGEDTTRCIEEVFTTYESHQCRRKRGFGPEGLYCYQHDPERIKALWDAKEAV